MTWFISRDIYRPKYTLEAIGIIILSAETADMSFIQHHIYIYHHKATKFMSLSVLDAAIRSLSGHMPE